MTAEYLRRAARAYLDRFASSGENLRRVLHRKAVRRAAGDPLPADLDVMVAETVARMVSAGFLDDRLYADVKANALLRKGLPVRGVQARLHATGLAPDLVRRTLDDAAPDDAALARRFAQRKRLGPWRTRDRAARRDRDVAALCRQGFPPRIAIAAIDGTADDAAFDEMTDGD